MAVYYHNIPTSGHPIALNFKITAKNPVVVVLKGYDNDHQNSFYFDREIGTQDKPFTGSRILKVLLPVTPENLVFIAYDGLTKSSNGIEVSDVVATPLETKTVVFNKPEDNVFFTFAEWFAKSCGYIAADTIYNDKAGHHIKLSKRIYNPNGQVSSTPARMFRPGGEIEVSKEKFDKMTVPMRMLILLHEYAHWRGNTRDEGQADRYAINMYLGRGYPKSEAIYAFTKIFTPVNQVHANALIKRTDDLLNYIKQWK